MTDELWHAGFGKADITVFEPGIGMFGWGQAGNVARHVAAPLHARALALHCPRTGARLVYVCAELGFISQHLRQLVVERARGLGLDEHAIMLTATHTHSGPNGYSAYLLYGVTGPGFSRRVAEGLADGFVRAMQQALSALAPARLRFHTGHMPLSEPVAFNRDLAAYNANSDVEPLPAGRSDEAVDRRMSVLCVETPAGRARGMVCWFGVHGTSVHSDNTHIHPDNKGIAAERCEQYAREKFGASEEPFIALFAQEAAGDVTPNFRWSTRRKMLIGRYDDDFASAEFSGATQARVAWQLFLDAARAGELLTGELLGQLRYRDFSQVTVDPDFAFGLEGQRTTKACLGLGFAFGTLEGPGPAFAIRQARRAVSVLTGYGRRLRRCRGGDWRTMQGPKPRFFDLGHGINGRMLTWLSMHPPVVRYLPDDRARYYSRVLDDGCMGGRPWAPEILPIQLFRIGSLCIAGVPMEPTTHSGRRLRAALGTALASQGVRHAVINGYANAYASYVATYEEYQLQHYEGASTLFGQWTSAALCTELRQLARDLPLRRRSARAADTDLDLMPPRFTDEPLLPALSV